MSIDKYSGNHTLESLEGSISLESKEEYIFLKGPSGVAIESQAGGYGITLSSHGPSSPDGAKIELNANTGNINISCAEYSIDATVGVAGENNIELTSNDQIKLRAQGTGGEIWIDAEEKVVIRAGAIGSPAPSADLNLYATDDINLSADDTVLIKSGVGTWISNADCHIRLEAKDKIKLVAPDGVEVTGDLECTGGLTCDTFTVDGESVLNDTIDWSDVHPETGIKLRTEGYDGLTLLAAKHLSVVSSAGLGAGVDCEIGGYITKIKGRYINIGHNYSSTDTSWNNDWAVAHGPSLPCYFVNIGAETNISSEQQTGHVLTVDNKAGSFNNNGIKIHLNSEGATQNLPTNSARWLEFRWNKNTDENPGVEMVAGSIRGVESDAFFNSGSGHAMISDNGNGNLYYPAVSTTAGDDIHNDSGFLGSGYNFPWSGSGYPGHPPLTATPGNAQFVSGLADFGEFFEVGDISEWPDVESRETRRSAGKDGTLVGLPEGIVVWVCENKFYKYAEGDSRIPMFITKRSIVTGDGGAILSEEGLGEVLSFCGKLPIIVKGATSPGDYIVPEHNQNYCYAISSSDITFAQYKNAMGRALSGCKDKTVLDDTHPHAPGQETELFIILCAVGIK
jgi:hypothetical protein